jgi:hypothetical protein
MTASKNILFTPHADQIIVWALFVLKIIWNRFLRRPRKILSLALRIFRAPRYGSKVVCLIRGRVKLLTKIVRYSPIYSKHFLPGLACFCIRHSRNMAPTDTLARTQSSLCSKNENQQRELLIFIFTNVSPAGIEHYMFSTHSGYFCSAFASKIISEWLRFRGPI